MEIINPFEGKGNWYKGNLHTHTNISDGKYTAEEICELYSKKGYQFIAITDHNIISKEIQHKNMLVMRGVELHPEGFHIVGIEVKNGFASEETTIQKVIDMLKENSSLVIIAHPYWSGKTSSDLLQLNGYTGIEVYNNVCHHLIGKGYSSIHLDEVLQTGKKIFGFAVDDSHSEEHIGSGFIMVRSSRCDKEDIALSIKKGHFYSSTGVSIKNISLEDNIISVECDPAEYIDFIGYNSLGKRFSGKDIRYAEYQIKGNEIYIRIEITDRYGKKAWTNPVVFL
ncbi:MAG: CehA/McbA family metallohydrolase [bacterium]|nr:CehA/McbA family metallohydrolase [bacterium]